MTVLSGMRNPERLGNNTGYTANQEAYYAALPQTYRKASDCIRCGLREKIARRGFRRDLLETVAEALEAEI